MSKTRIFKHRNFSLRYAAWGDPKHTPILFFHGFPGSHVQARGLLPFLDQHRIFLIAADRPGYGETIGQGSPLDYLDDLKYLLTYLNVPRFHILGISGGSPWAHLMASRFSDSIESLVIVCGLSPYNADTKQFFTPFQQRGLMIGRWFPVPAAHWLVNKALRGFNPSERLKNFIAMLDEADRNILSNPANRGLMLASMAEARRQGPKGIVNDAKLYHQDWLSRYCDGEALRKIPTMYYHGRRDFLLDHRMSKWMHEKHGKAELTLFDNEGHYSLPFQRADEILQKIKRG